MFNSQSRHLFSFCIFCSSYKEVFQFWSLKHSINQLKQCTIVHKSKTTPLNRSKLNSFSIYCYLIIFIIASKCTVYSAITFNAVVKRSIAYHHNVDETESGSDAIRPLSMINCYVWGIKVNCFILIFIFLFLKFALPDEKLLYWCPFLISFRQSCQYHRLLVQPWIWIR